MLSVGAYVLARETSVFAVTSIEVRGGSPRVRAEVRTSLEPELGRSLLALHGATVVKRVESIPDVAVANFDRSFPHTLRITIGPERADLLLRQGATSWVVSTRGRVMRKIANPTRSSLPRAWLSTKVAVAVGETLPRLDGGAAAVAVAPLSRGALPGRRVRTVIATASSLTFVMRKGAQIRLGDLGNLRLKLAIADRVLRIAAQHESTSDVYVDVSVPGRPVLGPLNSQVGGIG
jgi:cell division protein FtsQ